MMSLYSPVSLRRRWQRLLPFRNAMYPILVALLVIHAFWVFYDITITSHEHHRPKRKPIQVTESSPLSPFYSPSPGMDYVGFSRAFPVWRNHFPCGPLEDEYTMRTREPATEGIFYIKEVEASAAIFSSVTARIARNMGQRQQQQKHGDKADGHITNYMHKNVTAKVCTTRLVGQRARRFHDRTPQKSFLWSVVREPVGRLVSKFYHYGNVKTKKNNQQTQFSRFQNFVFNNENQDYGYYFRSLGVNRKLNPYKKEHEKDTREILESYDFLGVSERMDESLAVLKIILNLDIQDVLYLPTPKAISKNKNAILMDDVDYYENWRREECRPIPKPEITFEMKEWFYSEEFEAFIEADVLFYKAVNASLDKTISELGQELVEKTVKQLRWAQKLVQEECQNTRFPCSPEGELHKETDCLFSDIGCGYSCLDDLGEKLSQKPGFSTLFQ